MSFCLWIDVLSRNSSLETVTFETGVIPAQAGIHCPDVGPGCRIPVVPVVYRLLCAGKVVAMSRILLMLFSVLTLWTCFREQGVAEQPGTQVNSTLKTAIPLEMQYLLYLPKEYDKQDAWPLMLFLHGGGERGDDVQKVKMHGPPKLVSEGKEFPFMVLSPLLKKDRFWEPIELSALLDEVIRTHKVDQDRIWVTGLSSGGFGTWQLAAYSPDRFAALVPICGGGETYWTKSIKHVPVWAFHGAKDPGIPVRRSQEMVDAINGHGGKAQLTVYPEAGHNSWTETYNNPAVYEWLLLQKRTARP
jgi:poly(3-hydroxybutyrate) depolymerase